MPSSHTATIASWPNTAQSSLDLSGSGNVAGVDDTAITIRDGAGVLVAGSRDRIAAGGGAAVTLAGRTNTVTVTGAGTTLDVAGHDDRIAINNGSVILEGSSDAQITGSNNNVSHATGQSAVFRDGAVLNVVTSNGIAIGGDNSVADVSGSNNTVIVGDHSRGTVTGDHNFLKAGDYAKLHGHGGVRYDQGRQCQLGDEHG